GVHRSGSRSGKEIFCAGRGQDWTAAQVVLSRGIDRPGDVKPGVRCRRADAHVAIDVDADPLDTILRDSDRKIFEGPKVKVACVGRADIRVASASFDVKLTSVGRRAHIEKN